MESVQSDDQFTNGPDGKPSRVTDYKLYFPHDFDKIAEAQISFDTDEHYMQPAFTIIAGQITTDIVDLQHMIRSPLYEELGIVHVSDGLHAFKTKTMLRGEAGIGFQITPDKMVEDFLHTHTVHPGEDSRSANLFSAFDLWSMASKGAKRYWLPTPDTVWCLVNLYGQQYYYDAKEACMQMAQKYNLQKTFEFQYSNLIECVNNCAFRLYREVMPNVYHLVS